MSKRAAIIVTDADGAIVTLTHAYGHGQALSGGPVGLSEQLLTDLQSIIACAEYSGRAGWVGAAARLRRALEEAEGT